MLVGKNRIHKIREGKNMKKIFKGTVRKIITILLILVCLAGVAYFGIGKYTTYMNKTTKLGFENIGELATQSAYCTGVGSTDYWRKMFGSIKIPFTESKYVFSCDVVIKAGYDFADIDYDVERKEKVVTVHMPEAKILSSELKLDSFKVYHQQESVFNNIKVEENIEELKKLKKQTEEDAKANGLLENARTNAETLIKSFLSQSYNQDEYKYVFKDK